MNYYIGNIPASPELTHHGIKGMKWGVRRFQNSDGSLTAAGQKRYGKSIIGEEHTRYSPLTPKESADKLAKSVSKISDAARSINKLRKANKAERNFRNDILNKSLNHDNDFDRSKEGSKLLKEYQRQIKSMENDSDWDDNPAKQEKFYKAESSYLRAQGKYTASKILKSDGEKGVAAMMNNTKFSYKNVNELVDRIGDYYVNVHSI